MRAQLARLSAWPSIMSRVASTGVIGELMPMDECAGRYRPFAGTAEARRRRRISAQAILTTDLTEKHIASRAKWTGRRCTIGGAAKGSGMIHPNMATMLAFMTTDAVIDQRTFATLAARK